MTGENFEKRGGIGPSVCYLCLKDEESTQHLLLNCEVALFVLMEVCIHLKIQAPSICMNVSDFLKQWFISIPKPKKVPFFVLWEIWKYRNRIIFDNHPRNDYRTCMQIVSSITETYISAEVETFDYIMNPMYFGQKPLGFFDGAAVADTCGVEIVLKLSRHRISANYIWQLDQVQT